MTGPQQHTARSTGRGWRRLARLARLGLVGLIALAGGCSGSPDDRASPDIEGSGYTLAGVLQVTGGAAVDADLNDPNQAGRTSNDDVDHAQPLTAPTWLVGTVNRPGSGPIGASRVDGDETDVYVIDLQGTETVELAFSADDPQADLDLHVLSADGRLVGSADGSTGRDECIRITQPGRHYLMVAAFRGAAVYQLRVANADSGAAGCSTRTVAADFAPGELVARARSGPSTRALVAAATTRRAALQRAIGHAGVRTRGTAPATLPHLLTLPADAGTRRSGLRRLAQALEQPTLLPDSPAAPARADATAPDHSLQARFDTLRYAKALRATGLYDYVQPDWRLTSSSAPLLGPFPPDDPDWVSQRWHHEMIALPAAINRLAALPVPPAQRPVIAIVDTGVMLDHPDLQAQFIASGRTFVTIDQPGDGNRASGDDVHTAADAALSHGTHVAGTAAATAWNGLAVAGVAPMARLMPLNVFGRGSSARSHDIIQAMLYAAGLENNAGMQPTRRADVINLSAGSPGPCSAAFQDAIDQVRAAGVLVVAASGSLARNDLGQPAEVQQPANCRGVIAVGAVDAARRLPPYANTGATLTLTAPGGNLDQSLSGAADGIFSTLIAFGQDGQREASVGVLQGTSMAAPQVSGVLALMRYVRPTLTPDEVDRLIAAGTLTDDLGEPGRDPLFGWGLVNARKAVEAALADTVPTGTLPAPLVAQPARLDFGGFRSTATLELSAPAAANDRVASIHADHVAVTVSADSVEAGTGLGRYLVAVDRRKLATDGLHTATLTVTLASGRLLVIPVTLERTAGSLAGGSSLGPVYVTVSDADSGRVLHTVMVTPVRGRYVWQVSGVRRTRVTLRAGADLNNDGLPCGAGEPCSAPVSSAGTALTGLALTLTGDRRDLVMTLAPREFP
jgi:serine protease